jgi:hypothetical protein
VSEESAASELPGLLDKPVDELKLGVRASKCMHRLGIITVGDLVRRTADELLASKNVGMTTLAEVREKLRRHGLDLAGDPDALAPAVERETKAHPLVGQVVEVTFLDGGYLGSGARVLAVTPEALHLKEVSEQGVAMGRVWVPWSALREVREIAGEPREERL